MAENKIDKASEASGFYDRHIFICLNERPAGHPKGCCAMDGHAEKLLKYMKVVVKQKTNAHIRVNKAGCLDRCELGPVMVIYPDNVWYHYRTQADIDEIVEKHLVQGKRVDRLMLHRDQKKLAPKVEP